METVAWGIHSSALKITGRKGVPLYTQTNWGLSLRWLLDSMPVQPETAYSILLTLTRRSGTSLNVPNVGKGPGCQATPGIDGRRWRSHYGLFLDAPGRSLKINEGRAHHGITDSSFTASEVLLLQWNTILRRDRMAHSVARFIRVR
jgi:hypothetical protein